MLFAWPLVCVILFVRLPVESAATWSMLAGYLLLPSSTSVDIPLLPSLDKFSIPALTTFVLCWMKGTRYPAPQRSVLIYCLAAVFVICPILTSFTNSYELEVGGRSIPGFYPLDALKYSLNNILTLAPFFVGMRFLSSDKARAYLLKAIPTAALFYSLPMLFEIRMSPQLHRMVYGFFPHSFAQQIRDGGFRPVVFLQHGLEVALFASLAMIAAAASIRAKWRFLQMPAAAVTTYLAVILLLCKTLGAAIYAFVLAPIILILKPTTWVRISLALTLLVCAYPLLRSYNLVPVHHIADLANEISSDRSSSFQMRVKNEDILLEKANQKSLLGWGTWGRNRVYDQRNGDDLSITDGEWINEFGMFGWLGYLSLFGLFASSVFRARLGVKGPVTEASVVTAGMSLLLAVKMIDLLPNSGLLPIAFLMAGSVAGCVRSTSPQRTPTLKRNNVVRDAIAAS